MNQEPKWESVFPNIEETAAGTLVRGDATYPLLQVRFPTPQQAHTALRDRWSPRKVLRQLLEAGLATGSFPGVELADDALELYLPNGMVVEVQLRAYPEGA